MSNFTEYGCQNQCQIIQKYRPALMSASLLVADAESRHFLSINNQPTEITFRYYSPPKCQESQTSNISNQRQRSGGIKSPEGQSNESAIEQEFTIIRQNIGSKVPHAPEKTSDKFYNSKIQEIKYLTLDGYQQLQDKLLRRNLIYKDNKIVKLKLISPSADGSREKEPKTNSFNHQSYIKRVQINLKPTNKMKMQVDNRQSGSKNTKKRVAQRMGQRQPRFLSIKSMRRGNQNIVIKLYGQNQKDRSESKNNSQCNSYMTPRRKSCSHRKGITVYSTSTRKQSLPDDEHFTKTENNIFVNNPIAHPSDKELQVKVHTSATKSQKNFTSNRKEKKTLKEKYGEEFVEQLKKKTEKTRKRVYSKSKLGLKESPMGRVGSNRRVRLEA